MGGFPTVKFQLTLTLTLCYTPSLFFQKGLLMQLKGVPGIEKVEEIEKLKKYRGVVSVGLGSVKARFNGEVDILELDEPNFAKLKAHGTATGSAADALSEMKMSDAPDNSTLVEWTADINVSGQLASLVSRLMVPVSQKLASVFYDEVKKRIEKE
jgi:carbon monoxide dehydrogenase subunit G